MSDDFARHEALHMAHVATDFVERNLGALPAILERPEWRAKVDTAVSALAELYQMIGNGADSDHRNQDVSHPKVYTPETLAKRWGCSAASVRNMIRRGRVPAFRLGGKLLRIRATDVEEIENRGDRQGQPDA